MNGSHRRALYHAVEGSINQMWTISALQMHQHGIIVCDYDACSELKVGTYKYFLDIEHDPGSIRCFNIVTFENNLLVRTATAVRRFNNRAFT